MGYISMSPKVICEGAKRPSWGGGGLGGDVPLPVQRNFCICNPKKTVSDAYFVQRLLEYDFLQMARGKTIISSVKHAVSDTLIIIISKRAKRASASGNDLYFHVSESNLRGELRGSEATKRGRVWKGKFCIWSPKTQF